MQRVYFPGLHFIRGYAAVAVLIGHAASMNSWWLGETRVMNPLEYLFISDSNAVTLFFVLSGFLITYLLLSERERTGQIDQMAFYMRRIFRIWPLYFLGIALVSLLQLIPNYPGYSRESFVWLIVLAPNVAHALDMPMGALGHLWSIGVEEQFYLLWPALMRRIPLAKICIAIIALKWLLYLVAYLAQAWTLYRFLSYTRIESMAIGGLGAWALYHQHPALRFIYSRAAVAASAIVLVMISVLVDAPYLWPYDTAISVVFLVLIMVLARRPYWWTENAITQALGNMSYSLYVLHLPLIGLLVTVGLRGWPLMLTAVPCALLLSYLSYNYFESAFLRYKTRVYAR